MKNSTLDTLKQISAMIHSVPDLESALQMSLHQTFYLFPSILAHIGIVKRTAFIIQVSTDPIAYLP